MTINKSSAKYCQTETIISSSNSISIKAVAMTLHVASVFNKSSRMISRNHFVCSVSSFSEMKEIG